MTSDTTTTTTSIRELTTAEKEGAELVKNQIDTDRRPQFVAGRIFAIWESRKLAAIKSAERWPASLLRRDAISWFNRLLRKGAAHEAVLVSKQGGRSLYEMDIISLTSFFRFNDLPSSFEEDDILAFGQGYYAQKSYVVQRSREVRESLISEGESSA